MKHRLLRSVTLALAVVMMVSTTRTRAQSYDYLVYDDANWYEAYLQLLEYIDQFLFWIHQVKRLPIDMSSRYHGHTVDLELHDLESGLLYARRLLEALNEGDPSGTAYRQAVDPLDVPTDIVGRMTPEMQDRLTRLYAGLELADSVGKIAIDEIGWMRGDEAHNAQVAKTMERDAASTDDSFQTQTAILNKINAAVVLGLRIQDHASKGLTSLLEQFVLTNKRERDAEARLMNATIYQWRYGQAYGEDLFRNTAANIDTWRLR